MYSKFYATPFLRTSIPVLVVYTMEAREFPRYLRYSTVLIGADRAKIITLMNRTFPKSFK